MRVGVVQMTSSDDPVANLPWTKAAIAEAAAQGATLICTPEMTNCVSLNRDRLRAVLAAENEDITLLGVRAQAAELGVWIALGSLAIATDDADGRAANRSFLIDPTGRIAARYDKIHMFDVNLPDGQRFRESSGYRPGDRAVLGQADGTTLGLCVCYDMRFPQLAVDLAKAGAEVLLYPSAFAPVTGQAHWKTLLRARAIETGCYVIAAAQTGTHGSGAGTPRQTHGHSLVVDPWGEVLLDAGTEPGVHVLDLDLARVAQTRDRIPSLSHSRPYDTP